ncbi:MAG TPA: 4-(cytidine 5'-diphospho)-2-C-methyl-D-erythritol kinase [Afifellaceae bacterium]|nr:4-(cytidine 5'-diphospho)-2-C-methyl-D-erythritol kinase [Afifellaceae bacterium]
MKDDPDRPVAVTQAAPAKINLALHVTGRRADGYHELGTLAVFADCGEHVVVQAADDLRLRVEGPFSASLPNDETNLVTAAARIFFSTAGFDGKALLSLNKTTPVGAGLGGGSADAAATFRALNQYFNCAIGVRDLAGLGADLGADIPMCVYSQALRATGTGEVIEPLSSAPPLPLVLVWPGRPVATASVFKQLRDVSNPPLPRLPEAFSTVRDVVAWLADTRNDLQAAAIEIEPVIADTLEALAATDQCLLVRMSGTGSACFGIYPDIASANAAEQALRISHPNWWIRAVWAN